MTKKLMVIVMATLIVGLTWMVYAPTYPALRLR